MHRDYSLYRDVIPSQCFTFFFSQEGLFVIYFSVIRFLTLHTFKTNIINDCTILESGASNRNKEWTSHFAEFAERLEKHMTVRKHW